MGFQINQVTISGNLTREPELRTSPGGTQIVSFGLAHNERRKNQQSGDWEDRAHFFEVTVFGGQGEWLARQVTKGDPITVSGQLEWRQWEDKNGGGKRSAVSIVARDVVPGQRGGGGGGGQSSGGGYGGERSSGSYNGGGGQGGGYDRPKATAPAGNGGPFSDSVDTSDFAPAPRGGLADPGDDDIPF
jgi:single-strand DNA-binding protein